MAKEAYYFSHDANARQDEKILMLRAEHSWEGYGIYWALIEMMFESSDSALHHNKIKGIAVSYNIDITLLQHVINTCITEGLFASDNDKFWSESLIKRKSKFLESREKKSAAGKKGMAKRYGKQQPSNGVITEPNKVKESKVKEIDSSTTDFYEKVRIAYTEIHQVLDMPLQDSIPLSKMLKDGIPPELIINTMKDKFKLGVKTIKYYMEAINERFNDSKPKKEKVDPQIATRHREIAFNRFMDKGGKPDEFIYNAPTGT